MDTAVESKLIIITNLVSAVIVCRKVLLILLLFVMAPNTATCPVCKKNITKSHYSVRCNSCREYFHPECVNMQESELRMNKSLVYLCMDCSNAQQDVSKEYIDRCFKKLDDSIERKLQQHKNDFGDYLKTLEQKMDTLLKEFKLEIANEIKDLKEDLSSCHRKISNVKQVVEMKCEHLEKQNRILQRRLNRSNIVINGLPRGIQNIRVPIENIVRHCKISINHVDIQHCCYFAGGKSILVKFNSVQTRDALMASYHKSEPILLCDVYDVEARSRVYLNDHLTPDAAMLAHNCRKLRERKIIHKYKLINGDISKAIITTVAGVEKTIDSFECENMLKNSNLSNCPV